MKVWHLRIKQNARAFADPKGIIQCSILFIKGWRPFNHLWWSKPSNNLKKTLHGDFIDSFLKGVV